MGCLRQFARLQTSSGRERHTGITTCRARAIISQGRHGRLFLVYDTAAEEICVVMVRYEESVFQEGVYEYRQEGERRQGEARGVYGIVVWSCRLAVKSEIMLQVGLAIR